MARPKSNGPYAPLSATYFRDDAILAAGEQAELLFVRCLAFLADAASDGYITDRQMRAVVGMGMRNIQGRIDTLVEVGLITRVVGDDFVQSSGRSHVGFVSSSCRLDAYLVRGWLKWNKTTDEIGKHLKQDRERKSASKVANSARNEGVVPPGIQTDSSPQYTSIQVNTNQVNTQKLKELGTLFDDAYSHWPKRVKRDEAFEKFKVVVKVESSRDIADAIIRFGDAYSATTAKQFVPALGVWLNQKRWSDELPTSPEAERKLTATDRNMSYVEQLQREASMENRRELTA
jgi:hypothetical protein